MAIVFPPISESENSDELVTAVQDDLGDASAAGTTLYNSLKYMYQKTAGASMASVIDDSIIAHILAKDGDVSDFDDQTDSLEAIYDALSGGVSAVDRVAGKMQCALATIDLNQAAATYDLFTGTTQDVIVDRLMLRIPNDDISSNATLTSIAIVTDDATVQTFIGAVAGAVANLTAEAQLAAAINGILLKTGKKIRLTIAGGAVGRSVVADIVTEHRAVIDGGYLA